MTQEDKDLLLKYLCMALPYGVMIKEEYGDYINVNLYNAHLEHLIDRVSDGLDKLVLRPMSSMTDDEEEELRVLKSKLVDCNENNDEKFYGIISEIHNLYLSHYIDFMGLIPKGLAIEIN